MSSGEPVMCPHGLPLAENVCGPCSRGRPMRQVAERAAYVAADDDEIDERDDSPYCDCGAIPDEDEEASGRCKCCGKIVEWMP